MARKKIFIVRNVVNQSIAVFSNREQLYEIYKQLREREKEMKHVSYATFIRRIEVATFRDLGYSYQIVEMSNLEDVQNGLVRGVVVGE